MLTNIFFQFRRTFKEKVDFLDMFKVDHVEKIYIFDKLNKQFWMRRLRRAEENIYSNRQEKSRRPKNLPSHSDIDNFELYK